MLAYCYQPLAEGGRGFRLVSILPAAHVDDAIVIDVRNRVFDVQDVLYYEALSYVWGTEEEKRAAFIGRADGPAILVTQNLHDALLHLRDEHSERIMWIDAICINQNDAYEKEQQVSFMHEIYRCASKVVVWMGPEANGSDQVLSDLRWLGSQIRLNPDRSISTVNGGADIHGFSDPSSTLPFGAEQVASMHRFLCRPWFDRVWIRQEIYMAASEAVVQCGRAEVSWSHFRNALVALLDKTVSGEIRGRLADLDGLIEQIRQGNETRKPVNLCGLRYILGNSLCKDPRDRLYAVRGLCEETGQGVDMAPNYNLPTHEAYHKVVTQYAEVLYKLDVLAQCHLQAPSPMPTWVPDWSVASQWAALWQPQFASSQLASVARFPYSPDKKLMRVAGVVVATVRTIVPTGLESGMKFGDVKRCLDMHVSRDLGSGYPRRHGRRQYAITALTGRVADTYHPPSAMPLPEKRNQELLDYLVCEDGSLDSHAPRVYAGKSVGFGTGRVFFRTDDGRLGIGPASARSGDRVCSILGCTYLMLLRPTEEGRSGVVSSCYVDGAKYAEPILGSLPQGVKAVRNWAGERGWQWAFLDETTGVVNPEDPRLVRIPGDLREFRRELAKNKFAKLRIGLEALQKYNSSIQNIDLV